MVFLLKIALSVASFAASGMMIDFFAPGVMKELSSNTVFFLSVPLLIAIWRRSGLLLTKLASGLAGIIIGLIFVVARRDIPIALYRSGVSRSIVVASDAALQLGGYLVPGFVALLALSVARRHEPRKSLN
ncbi:hypothetical protein QA634_06420 [Methylobacterium sp. CB376]|uniref:hypothetical protein n=1 Tax=unclassified Methylobacterium TaxID=2615210 RepID=UPI00123754B4|nr:MULTISPECIES: hypothetical protein [Methylobacterium]WFT81515.1 hypothetical protein QA634_06420 [Methylobacterium nodulans]